MPAGATWQSGAGVIEPNTHPNIDCSLCGEIVLLGVEKAELVLLTDERMAADARGLVHGGFVFGAADHAAMLAVNDPNVVLGAASVKFLAPTRVGDRVQLLAAVVITKGRKRDVEVTGHVGGRRVFEGIFTCFVLEQHVLDS